MVELTIFIAANVLALIWITGLFARRALSKHDKLFPLTQYIMTLASLVTLAILLGQLYGQTLQNVVFGIAVVFFGFTLWAYLDNKALRDPAKPRLSKSPSILIGLCCFEIGIGLYGFFMSGVGFENYSLLLKYDCLRESVVVRPPPVGIYLVYLGIAVSLAAILLGTYYLVVVMYNRGLLQAIGRKPT